MYKVPSWPPFFCAWPDWGHQQTTHAALTSGRATASRRAPDHQEPHAALTSGSASTQRWYQLAIPQAARMPPSRRTTGTEHEIIRMDPHRPTPARTPSSGRRPERTMTSSGQSSTDHTSITSRLQLGARMTSPAQSFETTNPWLRFLPCFPYFISLCTFCINTAT
jgi:hypothetical protein